jgi:sulfur carrier protein ThiS
MRRGHSCGLVRVHATLHGFPEKERELDLGEGARADDAPRALGIRPELVLVFRHAPRGAGEGGAGPRRVWSPLPSDEPLHDGDRIRILRVVSGG